MRQVFALAQAVTIGNWAPLPLLPLSDVVANAVAVFAAADVVTAIVVAAAVVVVFVAAVVVIVNLKKLDSCYLWKFSGHVNYFPIGLKCKLSFFHFKRSRHVWTRFKQTLNLLLNPFFYFFKKTKFVMSHHFSFLFSSKYCPLHLKSKFHFLVNSKLRSKSEATNGLWLLGKMLNTISQL